MDDAETLLQLASFILLPIGLFLAFYLYYTRNFGYWKLRAVPEVPPVFPIGSLGWDWDQAQGKVEEEWYKKYGKIFGVYEGSTPTLMVADPELLKNILVKDFSVFPDLRGLQFGNEILDRMLFLQDGEHWKDLRSAMSPTFTSGKMRMMAPLINECAQRLVENYLENDNKEVDVTKYYGAFTMDVIASCAFGIKVDSRKDPDNPFVKSARSVFSGVSWRFILAIIAPRLARLFQLALIDPKATEFFKEATLQVIRSRKTENNQANKPADYIQLLLDAESETGEAKKLDINDVIGNCILFFIAGYFTTAATLSMTMHSLAYNPECQERLIQEIDETAKTTKEFDFDTVSGMKYLDAVVNELLRLRTPAPRVERRATEDYELGDTGITIPKGMIVGIPLYAIHHDPNYFPNPEKFDPDRFLPENKASIRPYTYIPFSTGPRNCLGMRFAVMEIKLAIVQTLLHVRFVPGPSSNVEIKFQKGRGLHRPEYIFLKVQRRQDVKPT